MRLDLEIGNTGWRALIDSDELMTLAVNAGKCLPGDVDFTTNVAGLLFCVVAKRVLVTMVINFISY